MKVLTNCAGVLLAVMFVVFLFGCGCGGSDPIIPQPPEQPVYRLQVILDEDIIYGGQVVNDVTVEQGTQRRFWVRLESRVGQNPWTIVTQAVQLDVTIEGSSSGTWMADIGLTGGQAWALTGQSRLEFQPPIGGHLGTAKLKLSVPEFGTFTHLWVTVVAPVVGPPPPPPPPSCRDLHPIREAIDSYWWDCVDGSWQNTGEPVENPSPQGEFYLSGSQDIIGEGGTIYLQEDGDGCHIDFFIGSTKLNPDEVDVVYSDDIPTWFWDENMSEFTTVQWLHPDYPDPCEPGNGYIDPGIYPVDFFYDGKKVLSITVAVTEVDNFPPIDCP